jgi:hypothetical protein
MKPPSLRLQQALQATIDGAPFSPEGKKALESLNNEEQLELSRLFAKACGVPEGDFPPRTEQHKMLEAATWTAAYEQWVDKWGAPRQTDHLLPIAAQRAAVARADAAVLQLAANGHKPSAVTASGCASAILLFASLAGLAAGVASCAMGSAP